MTQNYKQSKNWFLTVPRSGSNLLEETVEAIALIKIPKTHACWEIPHGKTTITIVRDPLDTLSSWAAMRMHYRNGKIKKNIIKQYCKSYQYLIDNADIIIDYNDLVHDPVGLSKKLLKHLGFVAIKDSPELAMGTDRTHRRHLVSSKKSDYYQEARKMMSGKDLSQCYELYNKLLSLKTKFD